MAELLGYQFDNVIRGIKTSSLERAKQVRHVTYNELKRLGVKRNKSKAIKGIPKGSDQTNLGSTYTWMYAIEPNQKKAIRQLVIIDATAVARTEG
ncbi:hypothetical protein LCGC14_0249300 [marine sediment metagenome]|uniref:Uncharacterized protein n=1 Tax=marine sediment metagenome TaxID=412755 RepID=A0A0F9ULP3_9ZZZZ